MSDLKESLLAMRQMAKTRIRMLNEGITFYDAERKAYYLREYEARVRELDQLIRRLSLKLVRPHK